jgi:hypothetical protein
MAADLREIVTKTVLAGGIIGFSYVSMLGLNAWAHTRNYVDGNFHTAEKPDGAFDCTEYTEYHDGDYQNDKVFQFKFFGPTRVLTDGSMYGVHDGKVDNIHIINHWPFGISGTLKREENYDQYKAEFDAADKLLAETQKRFEKEFRLAGQ